jgi:hypothetical protein
MSSFCNGTVKKSDGKVDVGKPTSKYRPKSFASLRVGFYDDEVNV